MISLEICLILGIAVWFRLVWLALNTINDMEKFSGDKDKEKLFCGAIAYFFLYMCLIIVDIEYVISPLSIIVFNG